VARHANTAVAPAKFSSVTQVSQGRLTELSLMILAWVIVGSYYVLASLGAKGHLPDRLGVFLTTIIAISLALHVCVRFLAPKLLAGLCRSPRCSTASVRRDRSVVPTGRGLSGALVPDQRRRTRRDANPRTAGARPRPLSLPDVAGGARAPTTAARAPRRTGHQRARLWVKVGPISFQPVEIAKILLVFFFASYFAANREFAVDSTQRIGRHQIVPPKVLLPILFAWGISMAILGAENDIGFACCSSRCSFRCSGSPPDSRTYVVLGMGLFAGGMYVAAGSHAGALAYHRLAESVGRLCDAGNSSDLSTRLGQYSLAAGGMTGTGFGARTIRQHSVPHVGHDLRGDRGRTRFPGDHPRRVSLRGLRRRRIHIAQRATSDYVRLAATGLTALMGFQAFFIMAGFCAFSPSPASRCPSSPTGGSSLFANYLGRGVAPTNLGREQP